MKKHLFLIASVFATFSLQAQTLRVSADTDVKVKSGTLFYVDGVVQVEKYTDASKKVSNEGNIKITQKLINKNDTGANFVNELVGAGSYGQLIVNNGGAKNEGKIASGVKFNTNFNFQTLALPYTGITAGDVVREAFGKGKGESISSAFVGYNKNGAYDENRYKNNALFFWDNGIYSLVELAEGSKLTNPERDYAISGFTSMGRLNTSEVKYLSGVPSKDDIIVNLTEYVPGPFNKSVNNYGEAYGSYIVDFTKKAPEGWEDFYREGGAKGNTNDYGANIFYFGNPYTSNIDLSKGEGFVGASIYQNSSNNYKEDLTVAASTYTYSTITASTGQGAGDNTKFVRPFGVVMLKFTSSVPSQVKFKNEMKTFEVPSDTHNTLLLKKAGEQFNINQVGLDLYDANGFTGAKTYVVASNIYEAAQKGEGEEIYNVSMSRDDIGIYTLQENEDGSVNEALADGKTYINGVNANKYVGKPIRLAFQNGKGKYTLKARLNESLEKNRNKFYFEDKVTGKVIKVEKDFEYSFDINGTDKDRFVLYWAQTPSAKSVDEVVKEEANSTVVYKDNNTYKVRFDKSIKRADVFVYNISGQLVSSANSVDTSVDYIVPLKGNVGVYILKVVGDNGKVVTKKIIK